MTNRTNVNAMAEKYKAEMMRLYNRSGGTPNNHNQTKPAQPHSNAAPSAEKHEIIEDSRPPVQLPKEITEDSPKPQEKPAEQHIKVVESPSKFPSPDEILAAESNAPITHQHAVPAMAQTDSAKGNYSAAETNDVIEDNPLEPLYSENLKEVPLSEMKGSGYIKAEITTAGGAVPIEGASVIITKREGDKILLIRMLATDPSGSTELVSLPAPDIVYSETPDPESKPFTEYIMSIYAEGFYAVPEIIVPVFTTVKSIQPVSLVPLAQFEVHGSTSPAENSRG